jgi:hypothetical protein
MNWPVYMPSLAINSSSRFPNLYGSLKTTAISEDVEIERKHTFCKRSTTARLVDNLFYEPANVTLALCIVESPEACSTYPQMSVGLEYPTMLPLGSDNLPHSWKEKTIRDDLVQAVEGNLSFLPSGLRKSFLPVVVPGNRL